MDARRKCSTCGQILPAESEGGACASCGPETVSSDEATGLGLRAVDPSVTRAGDTTNLSKDDTYATVALPSERIGGDTQVGSVPGSECAVRRFGKYELLDEIARGAMGVVYRARQVGLGRVVALKMILSAQLASRDEVERFRVEAEAASGLDHPNIVPIYEVGEHDDRHYFTMKLIEGGSLAKKAAERPITPKEAAEIVATIARAVHHAHRRGILHRDLKPANVLLDEAGQPHVTDFGLAKHTDGDSELTRTGAIMGTPSYMPPEQAAGQTKALTVAADVYSIGAILYDLIAGQPPFRGTSAADTLWKVINEEPRRPRTLDPRIDPDLETIALKCLNKDPAQRYESADHLAEELGRWLRGEPITARPVTTTERALKWARRRPAITALCASIVAVSIAGLAGILWQWQASMANAEKARRLSNIAEATTVRARAGEQAAMEARHQARAQLVDFAASSGLSAARRKEHDQALLWFAQAVKLAEGDPERERLNRIRVRNWSRSVFRPVRDRAVAGFREIQDHFLSFEFHPTGRYLLALTSTGLDPIWDLDRDSDFPLPGGPRKVGAAAWSPDGLRLAVGYSEGRVEVREFPSLELLDAWDEEGGEVSALAYSPDGRLLAVGGRRGARVRDVEARSFSTLPLPHPSKVVVLVFDPSGRRLCTVASDARARVFATSGDATSPLYGSLPHSLGDFSVSHGGPDAVAPRFVDGGRVLLTVTGKLELTWREAATGAVLQTYESPNGEHLTALKASPDGTTVVALWANTGRLYSARDASLIAVIPHTTDTWVEDAAFSASGDVLAVAGQGAVIRFWSTQRKDDLSAGSELYPLRNSSMVARVRFSPDGSRLAVAHRDGRVREWKAPGRLAEDYRVPASGATRLAMSLDGRHALASGVSFRNGELVETTVFDTENGRPAGPPLRPGGVIVDAAFSPEGRVVATASSSADTPEARRLVSFQSDGRAGNVQFWDWASGQRVAGPVAMPTEPRGLDFSPDGTLLAVTCADGWVVLLEAKGGAEARRIDTGVRTRPYNANLWWSNGQARFTPDGRRLLTWEMGPTVHIWDPATGGKLAELPHEDRVETVAFGPGSDLAITAARDSQVRVWDLRQGRLAGPPMHHPRHTTTAGFAAEDGRAYSCADDGIFRIWDWRLGRQLSAYHLGESILNSYALTPDRRWLVTTGCGQTNLSDLRTGWPIAPPFFDPTTINLRVAIPPDGRRAIVTGFSGEVIGYDLAARLAPDEAGVEELIRDAELISGQRVDENGQLVPLNPAEWLQRWESSRTRP